MRNILMLGGVAALVAAFSLCACSQKTTDQLTTAAATPAGGIFCAVQTQGGGQLVVQAVDAAATVKTGAAAPIVAPLVGIAAASVQTYLNNVCAAAAQKVPGAVGSTGAVPAPAITVQTVPITPPPVPAS